MAINRLEKLQKAMDFLTVQHGIPGVVVGVTDRKKTISILSSGYSEINTRRPMTTGSLFEIGSISKSFTAITLLQLVEKGLLDLSKPVCEYLPIFKVPVAEKPITTDHLLSHSAGITSGTDLRTEGRYEVYELRHTQPDSPPGVHYHYSNMGYRALGLLAEHLYQKPYAQIIREQIFEPLQMTESYPQITHSLRRAMTPGYTDLYDDRPRPMNRPLVEAPWIESFTGEGSIASTAGDMLKYIRMLLNEGSAGSMRVLGESGFRLLAEPIISTNIHATWYGRGLMIPRQYHEGVLAHSGGMVGYSSYLLADRTAGLGVILLVNYPANTIALGEWLQRYILTGEDTPLEDSLASRWGKEGEQQVEYEGLYRDARLGEVEIRVESGSLVLGQGGQVYGLEPRGEDAFYCAHPRLSLYLLHFQRRAGQVCRFACGAQLFWRDSEVVEEPAPAPAYWQGLCGHYRSHSPWFPSVRILLRMGCLLLIYPDGDEVPLVELEHGCFREGLDELGPERVVFDCFDGAQALQLTIHGNRMFRSMEVGEL